MERQRVYCEIEFYKQFINAFPKEVIPTEEGILKSKRWVDFHSYLFKSDLIFNIKNGFERSHLLSQLREKIEELEIAKGELEKYSHNLEDLVAQKTADLTVTNSKLSGIINYCADGIIIIDEDGHIEQANPACENFVGLDEKNLIKMNFSNITK